MTTAMVESPEEEEEMPIVAVREFQPPEGAVVH
jgi:hypothetical protein